MSEFGEGRKRRWFTPEERREALGVLEECGGRVSEAARRLGCSKAALRKWRDSGPDPKPRSAVLRLPPEAKAAVADAVLAGRRPAEAAAAAGVSETSARNWARERADRGEAAFMTGDAPARAARRSAADLPDDPDELKRMVMDLQMENDLMRAVVELVKKDLGADLSSLTAREKARLALPLRATYSPTSLAARLDIPRSTLYYQMARLARPADPARAEADALVRACFDAHGARWGYRRVTRETGLPERAVRRAMREGGMEVAYAGRRRRPYSSYAGDGEGSPENLLLRDDGTHDFSAAAPGEKLLSDITEFRLPGGEKACLSPVLDCYDGALVSWSVGTSPTAALADEALGRALEGARPGAVVHTDRGCQYWRDGWLEILEAHGARRSMSRKATSPDNARMEGFFGTLKNEFFYFRDWRGVTVGEFEELLGEWLRWYNEGRPKASLGWMSPSEYRRAHGYAA